MACKRRTFAAIAFITSILMTAINIHLLHRHTKALPSYNEMFRAHYYRTDASSSSLLRHLKQKENEAKSEYTSECFRPNPRLKLKENVTLSFPVINLGKLHITNTTDCYLKVQLIVTWLQLYLYSYIFSQINIVTIMHRLSQNGHILHPRLLWLCWI